MPIEKVLFNKPGYQMLKAALDASALRQDVLAKNIANAETAGYRQQEVRFEDLLTQAGPEAPVLAQTEPGHLGSSGGPGFSIPRPQIADIEAPNSGTGIEPGAFDLERAMTELQENKVRYHALVTLISGKLIGLKMAIDSK